MLNQEIYLETIPEIEGAPLGDTEVNRILGKTMNKISHYDGESCYKERFVSIPGKQKRKKMWGVLLAGVCLFSVLTATAIAYFQLDERFLKFLNLEEEQNHLLEKAGIAMNAEAVNQGYRLVARESIGDHNNVYVLLDLIAPENTTLSAGNYSFGYYYFDIDSFRNYQAGYTVEQLEDENPNDNKISFIFMADASKNLVGKDITLQLGDLTCYTGEAEGISVVDGEWKLEFSLCYEDISAIYKPGIYVDFFGQQVAMKEIYLSPLSISLRLQGKAIHEYDSTPPALPGEPGYVDKNRLLDIKLILQDGSIIDSYRSESTGTKGYTLQRNCLFKNVINPTDVAAIEFLGERIELK